MPVDPALSRRQRFPPESIGHAVWLYVRFNLSQRAVEELLAERGLRVSYAAIRRWCRTFGPAAAIRPACSLGGDRMTTYVTANQWVLSGNRRDHNL